GGCPPAVAGLLPGEVMALHRDVARLQRLWGRAAAEGWAEQKEGDERLPQCKTFSTSPAGIPASAVGNKGVGRPSSQGNRLSEAVQQELVMEA
ncbi:unnamed protein product, partial [Discosporangium mesarthrocarpum]